MKILIANVGSTSFKFKLLDMQTEAILAQGKIENIGFAESAFKFTADGCEKAGRDVFSEYKDAVDACIKWLTHPETAVLGSIAELDAVGFKTVHGKGMRECIRLDENVLQAMEDYTFLAPAHNPPYIKAIRIFQKYNISLVALFEPAFHTHIPENAYIYGIPYDLAEKHQIRKYGFHGASHRYISQRAPEFTGLNPGKVKIISCHLGGSSSICAIKNGVSVDTSMGFSPQSGVLNLKRCGDLDPFVALYLQKAENLSVDEVADILNTKSGLVGISGIEGDCKEIEDAAVAGHRRARTAMDAFCYGILQYIGAYYVTLGGLDILAFTGGIGEHSAVIRSQISQQLGCFGVELDETVNKKTHSEAVISSTKSKVIVVVIPANEEIIVAREVEKLLRG
ncbi:acetate/propionate family kinase [candidate division KSB1 bacterium]|nr:acetate/propionate family kinase [candidate division KSB1 bacterium]